MASPIRACSTVALSLIIAMAFPLMASAQAPVTTRFGPWEVDVHVGGAFPGNPFSLHSQLPPPGAAFTTANGRPSRRVPSWFFGDGAAQFNDAYAAAGVASRISPLDPALLAPGLTRTSGGTAGFRVRRSVAGRFSGEFSLDFTLAPARLSGEARDTFKAAAQTFGQAWNQFPVMPLFATSDVSITEHARGQTLLAGAVIVDLGRIGSLRPYVIGGGGAALSRGSATMELFGYYVNAQGNPSSQGLSEFDAIEVRESAPSHAGVALLGGGISGDITSRWGWRVDARAYWMSSIDRITVTTSSGSSPSPNGLSAVTSTSPAIQISSSTSVVSSLSAPRLDGFATLSQARQWTALVTGGVYTKTPSVAPGRGPAVEVGAIGGFISSELRIHVPSDEKISFERRAGGAIGVFTIVAPGSRVSFAPEVLVTTKGSVERHEQSKTAINLTYLEVPLLSRVQLAGPPRKGPFVSGGLAVGLRLSASVSTDDYEEAIEDDVRTADAGLVIGGGFRTAAGLVELRYTHGLMNIVRDQTEPGVEFRNRTVAILFGLRVW